MPAPGGYWDTPMKTTPILATLAAALIACLPVSAASPKFYQVTGPVLEVTPTMIAVQKDNDRWEIARTADTKVTGDLKVGSKVTVYYTMTATKVDVK